jgi:uncharacterized membrane protein YeaQ/YmgE (transglycosylase-associated protein family)
MGIIWTIIIGFIAGVIAKFIMPGPNEPQGFILTTILGVLAFSGLSGAGTAGTGIIVAAQKPIPPRARPPRAGDARRGKANLIPSQAVAAPVPAGAVIRRRAGA